MLRLIVFLIILIASVWLGIEVVQHQGYLLVVYQPWTVQMPVWFALLSTIVFLVIFYLLITSLDQLQFWWFRVKNWFRFHREHRLYNKTQHGLILLIEGRWKKAERLLLAGENQSIDPLMNYLGAAKAAHEQGAYDRRDRYIKKAYEIAPNDELAIGIAQADLELKQDQLEHATATLNHLRDIAPYHPRVLQLLEKVYVRLADWPHLLGLLPNMRKAKMLNAEQVELFEKNIYADILNAASTKSLNEIHAIWQSIPKRTKKQPDVVCAYVKQLLRFNDTTPEVEELIRKTLKYNWQPELVKIYGTLPFTNLNRQLVIVGAWLKIYGPKPELLLTLGRLCVRVQLWGKAKDYFAKCLALAANAEASLEYGKLLEQLGEADEAMQIYRDGLSESRS
ncbi:MAG: hypothetical protein EPO11_10585 [Gammaproteobacteria bacterium]|nr:MAG: hypothetical protein EPO11_10585 [Gammaproteobacteria bacterium]